MNMIITNDNRNEIQVRYVDSIIARMDFMEIRELLREYLHSEKDQYTNDDLLDEIRAKGLVYEIDVFEPCDSLEGVLAL